MSSDGRIIDKDGCAHDNAISWPNGSKLCGGETWQGQPLGALMAKSRQAVGRISCLAELDVHPIRAELILAPISGGLVAYLKGVSE